VEQLRVLIVDDEEGMCLGVKRALRDFHFHVPDAEADVDFAVETASTGEEGLDRIAAQPPDILLLDHKLPGISGLDVLAKLEGRGLDTLTIMITAYASIDTAVLATKRGAYDFLPKPFTPSELKYTVQKAGTRLILARQARKLAEEKRKVRFEFIRVLGHELKAPLGAVESYLDIVRDRTLGDELDAYGEMIDRSLTRLKQMRTLIQDLLDMTRLESGQKVRKLESLDLVEVARSCLELQEPQANERGITLNLHTDGPTVMQADRGEIEIILNNLLSNAVKYNRDGGQVDLSIRHDGQYVHISVRDTGIGMTPEESEKLFQEFSRIRNKKTKKVLGTGLGLSILKRLVQLYNGDVEVQSEPDVGSTFTVHLRADGGQSDSDAEVDTSDGNPS
jgi:signal transduction histidine kinase